MPNHITNRLTIVGSNKAVQEVKDFLYGGKDKEGKDILVDFNNIVREPDDVVDWYKWRITNWGTKWNAYDYRCENNTLFFTTAWSGVPNLIGMLSMSFPNVTFEYAYADEDTGYNVDSGIIRKGDIVMRMIVEGSRQAYELAFELHPGIENNYELIDGNYVYKEEE